jgi:type II secretory pathway pseudopilin PulG
MEMLVALVIMALALALAGASLTLRPDDARQLATEAARLAMLLEQAREESALGGMALAWVAEEDRYEFERRGISRSGPEWTVVRGDDLLRPRQFPGGLHISRIEADGRPLVFGERLNLGLQGAQGVMIELAFGQERTRIRSRDDRFEVTPLAAKP